MNKVNVVVTGMAWMGSGIGSIESAIERLFRQAKQEILLTVFAIGTSPDSFLEWLEEALSRGVKINMIVNQTDKQPHTPMQHLIAMTKAYPHFHLFNFIGKGADDLHAKAIVVDRTLALVGSSNLSWHGMTLNHELAILIEGKPATEVAGALDQLIISSYVEKQ